jgi:anti-sigma regulatory factor (Ser/Thr protein kinase)
MTNGRLKIGELADQIGMHISSVRRLADAGLIPSEKTLGGQRTFELEAVKNALEVRAAVKHSRQGRKTPNLMVRPTWERTYEITGLEEHLVWEKVKQDLNLDMSVGAADIVPYAFNEMLNNAIDHSGGKCVNVRFWAEEDDWSFEIKDDGQGVFAKIKTGFDLDTVFESSQELSKGKRTTAPEAHSGEGIFFTSKSVDIFKLSSNEVTWYVDNLRDDQGLGSYTDEPGTRVFVKVSVKTDKKMHEIFSHYSIDHDFVRTRPAVKLLDIGVLFVSRSQAKRLLAGLETFSEIEIDFKGVESVGQGFVDELLRVWPAANPDKKIIPVNMVPAVEFMVKRVGSSH